MRRLIGYDGTKPLWSENEQAGPAKVSGWGSALISVVGGIYAIGESERARDLRLQKEAMARRRAK